MASSKLSRFVSPALWPALFMSSLLLWLFARLFQPMGDIDMFWHLASGRAIIEHGTVLRTDIFSLTATGSRWINTYWLFDVLTYAVQRLSGWTGLILLHALVVMLAIGLQLRRLREQAVGPLGAAAVALLIFFGSGARLDAWSKYASQVTVLFFSLLVYSLARWKHTRWDKTIWWAPALFCVWANVHRGFVIGLAVAACYVWQKQIGWAEFRRRFAWWLSCAAATLINPFGWAIFKMMRDDHALSSQYIFGWDAPGWAGMEIFFIGVGLFWAVAVFHVGVKKKFPFNDLVAAAFLTYLGLRHYFGMPLLMVFAAPLLVEWFPKLNLPSSWKNAGLGLAALACLILAVPAAGRSGYRTDYFPRGAFDVIEEGRLPGPFYNDYFFGGYWIWRLKATPPVFIDGRYPAVEGYIPLLKETNAAKYNAPSVWQGFLDKYRISGALVKYLPASPFPSLYEKFFPRDAWALVYWDDAGLLFLKRSDPANAAAIAALEFAHIHPDSTSDYFAQRFTASDAATREAIKRELLRNLRLHPDSWRTAQLLSLIF